jgi:hypothetical protein
VSTAVFDQSAIGFGDASFDAVINRHGLMFVESPVETVAEAVRVLRGGGRYAVMTWDRREANPWLGLVLDAVSEQFGVPFPPPSVRGPFSLDSPDVLTSVLRDGGLEDVTVEPVSTPMHAASLGEWWERVPKLAGPLAIALRGMEADVRDAIGERAMQSGAKAAASEENGIVFAGSVRSAQATNQHTDRKGTASRVGSQSDGPRSVETSSFADRSSIAVPELDWVCESHEASSPPLRRGERCRTITLNYCVPPTRHSGAGTYLL